MPSAPVPRPHGSRAWSGSTGLAGFAAAVEEVGGEVEDDRVVLARNVSAEGRSRAFVGGASVPVTSLAQVAEPLVAVHGQSDQHRLLQATAQRDALDRFGGPHVAALAATYADLHRRLEATETELDDVVATARSRAQEADLLRFGLGEIEAVSPQPGEDVTLAADETRLGFADTLRTAAEQAREALSSEDGHPDALTTTYAARSLLDGVREHDTEAGALADRLAELTYLLSDLAADVASYASRIDTDPARLAVGLRATSGADRADPQVRRDRRRGAGLVRAFRSRGCSTSTTPTNGSRSCVRARGRCRAELGERSDRAVRRPARRQPVAWRTEVTAELVLLAMPHARLTIEVRQTEVAEPDRVTGGPLQVDGRWLRRTASGVDEVELMLAANTGSEPRPLNKGASGGELSRVMLALEVALAGTSPVPTFVFDEVDAGVGGAAAVEVGRRLARLARSAQVLVVTHLPQVAAYADRHVVVEKSSDGTR